jgi:hypothetical protein
MVQTLWKLPVPATALVEGPTFTVLPKRACAISFLIEGENDKNSEISLVFEGVEAFKCTYYSSCTTEMINTAYGKLVELQQSAWLTDILIIFQGKKNFQPRDLHHLMIYFDDGPCYEIICSKFTEDRH